MGRKIVLVALVVGLLLATAVVPASAAQSETDQGMSLDAPSWSVEDGGWLIVPPGNIQPMCGCVSGGNCSCRSCH